MTYNNADYTETTARLAILKAKAAFCCKDHPEMLILVGDPNAETRAYAIAQNTVKYHDKIFLLEKVTSAVKKSLDQAGTECLLCTAHQAG